MTSVSKVHFLLKFVIQKCCYPEPGARAGQDWTCSTTLDIWISLRARFCYYVGEV